LKQIIPAMNQKPVNSLFQFRIKGSTIQTLVILWDTVLAFQH